MIVRSNSFENNAMIPKKHTGFRGDLSPELILSDIPKEAVYALDTELTLSSNSKKKELMDAMQGHVVAETELTGLYKNS